MAPGAEAREGVPPPLPPSVENAYRKKCIALKRRLIEVEEHNDQARIRKVRLERGIHRMRLERAFLLEHLAKRMKKNPHVQGPDGLEEEESEDSSEGPPTPPMERNERMSRRRSNNQRVTGNDLHTAAVVNGGHDGQNQFYYTPQGYPPPVPTAYAQSQQDQIPRELITPASMFFLEGIVPRPEGHPQFSTREEMEQFVEDEWYRLTPEQRAQWERRFEEKRAQAGLPPYQPPGPVPIHENSRDTAAEAGGASRRERSTVGAGAGFTAVNG